MQFSTNGSTSEAILSTTVVNAPSARVLATGIAVVAAVTLPQAAHVLGAALGLGPAVGQVLLPMFLPVMAVGLLAGPMSGFAAGAMAPLVSSLLTGMPAGPMPLFAMVPEVATLGFVCGILATRKLPWIAKVLVSEGVGLLVYAVATVIFAAVTGNASADMLATILTVAKTGFPGYVIQWTFLPLMMRVIVREESQRDRR